MEEKFMVCSYDSRVIKHIEGYLSIKNEVAIFYNSSMRIDMNIIAAFNTRKVFILKED